MKKSLFLLLLSPLFLLGFTNNGFDVVKAETVNYIDQLTYELKSDNTYKVIGVSDTQYDSYRIYGVHSDGKIINEIAQDAFKTVASLSSLMISENISIIHENAIDFNSLNTIYFTGSIEKWEDLKINTNANVFEYMCDEGFINYWNEHIRPEANVSICDISETEYQLLKTKYDELDMRDYEVVNAYEDKAGETIKDSMEYLEYFFNPEQEIHEKDLPKDETLLLIILISIIGMSAILIFYLLMKKGLIN